MGDAWNPETASYVGMHRHLRYWRGRAAEHTCETCGEQAYGWAYDHKDLNEKTSDHGPYSTDMDRYRPLCASCHKIEDETRAGRARCGTEGGYYRHRRVAEATCRACRDSHSAVARAATARRSAARLSPVPEEQP